MKSFCEVWVVCLTILAIRIHKVTKFWEIIWHKDNSPLKHLSILTNAIHSISRKSRLTLTLIRTKSICTRGVGMTWISITFVKIYAIRKENRNYDFEKISGIGKDGQQSVNQITKLTTVKITLRSTFRLSAPIVQYISTTYTYLCSFFHRLQIHHGIHTHKSRECWSNLRLDRIQMCLTNIRHYLDERWKSREMNNCNKITL